MIYIATVFTLIFFLFICISIYNKGKKVNSFIPKEEIKTIKEEKKIKPVEKLKNDYRPKSMEELDRKLYKIKPDLTFWYRNFPEDFLKDLVNNFNSIPDFNEFDEIKTFKNYHKNIAMVNRLKVRI